MDADNNAKAKTIATIEVNLPPKVSAKDWMSEYVDEHLHCVLCGTELNLQHKTDFIEQSVQEVAHCPNCNVRNRQSAHRLQ